MLAAFTKERIFRAGTGAVCGFLTAMAIVVSDMPVLPRSSATVAALCVIGVLVAVVLPARWIAVAAAVAAFLLFQLTFTPRAAETVQAWVRRDPPPVRKPDAVVALSATITGDGLIDPTSMTRLISALEAMRRTGAAMLVTTRPSSVPATAMGTALQDYQHLIGLAGDTSRWRVVGPVSTTHDEALATARLLAPAASHEIVVVTSPLHTRRACAAFENVGFHVTCWPASERRYALYTFSGLRTRLMAIADWLYERAAVIEYRSRGWIR
jgi:uncharacterized SAM-binding protein YcdF (DUF218 family)